MFGSVVPQHCKWVEILQCVGLEMVGQVVEWECIFEMDVDGVINNCESNHGEACSLEPLNQKKILP